MAERSRERGHKVSAREAYFWASNYYRAAEFYPDFAAAGSDGLPAIPARSHIRLASFEHDGGTRILRRGYSFTDGIDPQAGTLLGGLFFIAFMKNPAQFVRLQQSLAPGQDRGTALFA